VPGSIAGNTSNFSLQG
jgi:hypothetical protein